MSQEVGHVVVEAQVVFDMLLLDGVGHRGRLRESLEFLVGGFFQAGRFEGVEFGEVFEEEFVGVHVISVHV